MKRIAIAAVLLVLTACRKPAEAPVTTSSAPPPAPAAQTATTTTTIYVPPADVKATNAAVPTTALQLWLRADSGVTAGAGGKVSAWAVEGSTVKAVADTAEKQPTLVPNAIGGKPADRESVGEGKGGDLGG